MQMKTMNDDKVLVLREQLSALADGELGGDELARLMAEPVMGDDIQATWHAYQLIGDVLRSGEQAAGPVASSFASRLQLRLRAEEPLVAERPASATLPEGATAIAPVSAVPEPANDAVFRWKMVAGFASFAVVVAMGWGMVRGGPGSTAEQAQLATASPTVQGNAVAALAATTQTVEQPVTLANGEAQVMIRDARLDDLLTAHKQVGGGTALQMPAGFLRSATFAAPER